VFHLNFKEDLIWTRGKIIKFKNSYCNIRLNGSFIIKEETQKLKEIKKKLKNNVYQEIKQKLIVERKELPKRQKEKVFEKKVFHEEEDEIEDHS
jgi:hypothetical protein